MIFRPRDFRTTSAFAAVPQSGDVRGLEHAFTVACSALGARRLLSTPSRRGHYDGLGSVSTRPLREMVRAFADFDGFHLGRFPPRAQLFKSLVSSCSTTRAALA